MRFVRRDVRDLIAHQKNDHGASYRRHRVLQRRSCLKFDFREIFGVVRFSTFATESAMSRHRSNQAANVRSLRKYYGLIRLLIHVHARRAACRLPEPARHTSPGMNETSQVPRKELLHVHKVSDCARFFPCKPVRHGTMLPSLQRKEIGTSELDPFRSSTLAPWSPL